MLSKEEFVKIINNLKQVNDFVKETNDKARKLNNAIVSDFFDASSLSISHEDIVVELLREILKDDNDFIYWWMYELEYGKKYYDGCVQDADGKNINLSTAEKLYDFLIDEMGEK